MGGLAPAHHPGPAVHDGPLEAARLQLEVDIVRHEHLGGVGDGDRLLERLLELRLTPRHPLREGRDVQIEDEGVVGLDVHQLDVLVTDQLLKARQHVGAEAPHLDEERDREAERDLHALFDQRLEEFGRRPVAVLRHLVEVPPVHLIVEDQRVHLLRRSATRDQRCR